MKRLLPYFTLLVSLHATAQTDTIQKQPNKVLFILDGSYSMYRKWGKETLWDAARRIIAQYATTLSKNYGAEIGLRVYGHNFDIDKNNCTDTKLEVPIAANNENNVKEKLSILRARGTTPIAYSLSKTPEDFIEKGRNSIILITDGEESCGGNPCEVSKQLQAMGITLKPIVIGLDMTDYGIEKLKCIGEVSNSKSPEEFKAALEKSLSRILDKTTFQLHLTDSKNKEAENSVPISFFSTTDENFQNIYHSLNTKGEADTLFFGDRIQFNMLVHTIPPIERKNISLTPYKHNHIQIKAPQGFLDVRTESASPKSISDNPIKILIRKNEKTIHVLDINNAVKLLEGNYDIDIISIPRISQKNLSINDGKNTTIKIPTPGVFTINKKFPTIGGVFMDTKNGLEEIYAFKEDLSQESITILPGKYRIVYRAKGSKQLNNTIQKTIEIQAGFSKSIVLD